MAEANDAIKYWISMIKHHVDFDGIEGQEVHNFYSTLDDAEQASFNKFMRKKVITTITGITLQKGSGTDKYLKIDRDVFKSCLENFDIDINHMDIDNNNDNDNDNNNDNVKKNYPGTIDSKVNIVKKSVTSVIRNYSGLRDGSLRTIFPDVKWSFTGTGDDDEQADDDDDGLAADIAIEVADDIAQADDNEQSDDSESESDDSESESDDSESDSSESDSDESDSGEILKSIATDVLKPRTTRKDHVDLDVASQWLHGVSPQDTNTHGNYCVITKKGEEVVAEYHQRRTQVYDTNTLLEMFHQSQEYLDFQNRTE